MQTAARFFLRFSILLRCLLMLLCGPLIFFGCSSSDEETAPVAAEIVVQIGNTANDESKDDAGKVRDEKENALAYLSLRLTDEDGTPLYAESDEEASAFRTALPVLTASDFTSFTLYGSTDGGFAWQNLWASSGTATNALTEFTSAEIAVTEGFWNFRLIAQKGGAKYSGSVGRTEIVSGAENALSFTLSLYAIGADAENNRGGGKGICFLSFFWCGGRDGGAVQPYWLCGERLCRRKPHPDRRHRHLREKWHPCGNICGGV